MADVVHVTIPPKPGLVAFDATFGRRTVVLGGNGVGKSKPLALLAKERPRFSGLNDSVFVEGGRAVQIPSDVAIGQHNYNSHGTALKAERALSVKKDNGKGLTQRVQDVFLVLERRGEELHREHSHAVVTWKKSGANGPCPDPGRAPLDILFERFSNVFPAITISRGSEGTLSCRKDGEQYSPDALSDGEKQILVLLADVALISDTKSLIVVDEPELHLNATLACQVWREIEAARPESVFIYATHCLGFALRDNIDKVIVLGPRGTIRAELPTPSALYGHDLTDFLGAVPGIVSSDKALVLEGADASLDAILFRWVIGDASVAIQPIGGCDEVVAATTRTGVWSALTTGVKIVGVVDRDFKSDDELKQLPSSVLPLELHECESYLCLPRVICEIAKGIGSVRDPPTEKEIEDTVIDYFKTNALRIVAQRTFRRLSMRLGVSISRADLKAVCDSEAAILTKLKADARSELGKAASRLDDAVVEKLFRDELAACTALAETRDVERMLRLAPGKELVRRLANRAGCKEPDDLARAARKHVEISGIPLLERLAKALREKLG